MSVEAADERVTMRTVIAGVAPAAVLLVTAFGGSFHGEAVFPSRVVALVALGGFALLGAERIEDPLGLGSWGALLAWAPWLSAIASSLTSPVPRVAWPALAVMPFLILLPAAVARCWREPRARRIGWWALALVLIGVAIVSTVGVALRGDPRPASPLGHHNLLALWLLVLMPGVFGAVISASRTVRQRSAVVVGLVPVLGVLLATRSLAGAVGALVAVAVLLGFALATAGVRTRLRLAWATVALLTGSAALFGSRLALLVRGLDASALARLSYWRGGLGGFLERPVLGWGPRASSWTAAAHLEPLPPIRPAYEVVTDFHSLPVELLFERGVLGLVCSGLLFGAFVRARTRALDGAEGSRAWAAAGALAGLLGFATAALASGLFDVLALPVAVATAAGVALAAEGPDASRAVASRPRRRMPAVVLTIASLVLLAPDLAGHWFHQRALGSLAAGREVQAAAQLEWAARIDPQQPLYPFELATLEPRGAALLAARAARLADLPVFWLAAGARGIGSEADEALERACDLEPLDGMAPFLLALRSEQQGGIAVARLARALVAEPRLAAAFALAERPELTRAALDRVTATERWPAGWREALARQAGGSFATDRSAIASGSGSVASDETADLTLLVDAEPSTSLSLFAFRRTPLRGRVVSVSLRRAAAQRIDVPSLWTLPEIEPVRWRQGCGWLAPAR